MMAEAQAVAEALGVRFKISLEQRIAGAEAVGAHKTSMLQDVEAGRALELEALVGAVVELGRITGVADAAPSTPMRVQAAHRLGEVQRVGRLRPAVLVGGGAEVVPQGQDLPRLAGRQPAAVGQRQALAGRPGVVEQVAGVHLHRIAVAQAEALGAGMAESHPLHGKKVLRSSGCRCCPRRRRQPIPASPPHPHPYNRALPPEHSCNPAAMARAAPPECGST
jgi:hypothetical protein